MKLVRLLTLTSVATIAALAFVGTSPTFASSGVLLCQALELTCTHPSPSGTSFTAQAESPKILSSLGTIQCEKSTIVVSILQSQLNTLQIGHLLTFEFTGNCHLGGTSCTITVGSKGAHSITHGSNPLEWIYVNVPLEGVSTEISTKCGFLINCTYVLGEETVMTGTNSASGEIALVANESPLKKSKGFCPETSKWDATYKDTMTGLWLES